MATHLKSVLSAQGRKQTWLAKQAGVSQRLISYLLTGERTASAEVAERIALALGVPLFFVFDTTDIVENTTDTAEEAA